MIDATSHRDSRRLLLKYLVGTAAVVPFGLLQACAPASRGAVGPAPATAAPTAPGGGGSLQKVRYGDLRLLSDAGVYIALDEGYFAEQGIDLELTSFDSASNMVPPLGAGQIDAGGGALSAGLFNAMARGVKLHIVADKGHSDPAPPGFPISIFMVRKALADSGQVKSPADLKGRKYGYVARGISTELDLAATLKQGDLTLKDLEMVQMGFPDMVAAFASGAIDAAGPGEPFATNILSQGTGVILRRDYEVNPNNQVAALLYSEAMGKSDLGPRFMLAYLKAVRLYNDAFVKQQPAAREKAIKAMVAHSPVKDPALYDKMALQALHPDGTMNVASIEQQQEFFLSDHTQETRIDVQQFVDTRFIDQAARQLGPYA
jgi:NitT/TauT family transport system substrate-binding protein